MSLTALVWCGAFAALGLLSFRRSAWGFALYSLTIYASPIEWWWGEVIRLAVPIRWNLCAALIYAIAVFIGLFRRNLDVDRNACWCLILMFLFALNATMVHLLFASDPEHSALGLAAIWKNLVLLLLMFVSIRDKLDLKIVGWSILLGTSFLAYMVIFQNEGGYEDKRLENLPVSLASSSNFFGTLFGFSILLAGGMLVYGRMVERLAAFFCLPMMCEVLIRGNSRGTFLSLCAAAVVIVLMMKGKARIFAVVMCLLGILAFFAIMDDRQRELVFGRFGTTFNAVNERDESAAGRLDFWRQGVKMIRDYPMGSGFQAAFDSPRGQPYMWDIGVERYRSVHNGFLDVMAGWGIQGFLLLAPAYLLAFGYLHSAIAQARRNKQFKAVFFGVCLVGGFTVMLVTACFNSSLDREWYIWWMAMAFAFANVVYIENAEEDAEEEEEEEEEFC